MALTFRSTLIVAAALLVTGCTTKKTEAPDLSGPSELATSISLTASPDILNQDGQSTSAITILARDSNGQPLKGLSLRADIEVNNVVTDFGQLSAKNVATGADGRATVVYKAPSSVDSVDRSTMVTIAVTPLSGDAHADFARTVQIRLVPTGTVSGGLTQVPDFQISPTSPNVLESVTFDASDPTLDAKLVGYLWDFGDGSTGSGRTRYTPVPQRRRLLGHADGNRHRRQQGIPVQEPDGRSRESANGGLRLLAGRARCR